MKNLFTLLLACILSAIAAVALFNQFGNKQVKYIFQNSNQDAFQTVSYENTTTKGAGFDFTTAAKKGLPAVVHIRSTVSASQERTPSRTDLFEEFFGIPNRMPRQDVPQQGFGSGVVISPDGYVITNNHVIDNASKIEVTFYNSNVLEAELIGTDPTTDIALLKVKDNNLPYLNFADSDKLEVGEWVAAIGNPAIGDAYSLKSTVTAGIVSAFGRNIGINREDYAIESFIQTDAVINKGNSGGALVNSYGDLVGINTAITTPTGVYAGYGFAVPSNLAKKVVTDLKDFGKVQRAILGVQYQDIEFNKSRGLEVETDQQEGLLITNIIEGGAASKANLKAGDVLIKVDGNSVTNGKQNRLQEIIGRKRPDDKVDVTYIRNGKKYETTVKLISAEETSDNFAAELNVTYFEDLGLKLSDISENDQEELGKSGVRVYEVDRNGFLFQRSYGDISPGFIITEINNNSVSSVASAKNALRKSKNGMIKIVGFHEKNPNSIFTYTFQVPK